MIVRRVELYRIELLLAQPVATSTEVHERRPLSIVAIESDDGIGYGECAALERPGYMAEYADGAEALLRDEIVPSLLARGGDIGSCDAAMSRLSEFSSSPMALAATEMALLDFELKQNGTSLASYLGATTDRVEAGATVGIAPPPVVQQRVRDAVRAGYRRVKLKIAPGYDVGVLRSLIDTHRGVMFAVDANGAYCLDDPTDRAELIELSSLGLVDIEQPLASDDLLGHARLREMIGTPIVLDESVRSLVDLKAAIDAGALDGVAIKSACLGGLRNARALCDFGRSAGVQLSIGGMFESGIGRAAALAVGTLSGFSLPGDIGASERYFANDLTTPYVLHDGYLSVPSGPGLGVEVRTDVLEQLALRRASFTP